MRSGQRLCLRNYVLMTIVSLLRLKFRFYKSEICADVGGSVRVVVSESFGGVIEGLFIYTCLYYIYKGWFQAGLIYHVHNHRHSDGFGSIHIQ